MGFVNVPVYTEKITGTVKFLFYFKRWQNKKIIFAVKALETREVES